MNKIQNKQSYLSEITKSVKNNYNRFFDLVTDNTQVKQMPTFQLDVYIDKALSQKFPIIVQFNDHTPDSAGYLSKISDRRLLITSADNHFTRILSINEIQAIKKF